MAEPEKFIGKPTPEAKTGIPSKYDVLFERIAQTNILPSPESKWSLENLDQSLKSVFLDYGSVALEANGGKIHTTLSGGLDSTLAVAYLRKNFPTAEINTYTMGGTEEHPDVIHARIAAEKFDTVHHEYIPTSDQMAKALTEFNAMHQGTDLKIAGETGNSDVFMLYKYISQFKPKIILAHDGIDELMGGYWDHRKNCTPKERETIYRGFWDRLIPDHLEPLIETGSEFGIEVLFPYLDSRITQAASDIPLDNRSSIQESKKPLRAIARQLGVPEEILTRPKRGQVGMLDLS